MSRPRLVVFGSGSPLSLAALHAISSVGDVACVVVPAPKRADGLGRRLRGLLREGSEHPLVREARRRRLPVLRARPREAEGLGAELRRHGVRAGCIASFPSRLEAPVLDSVPEGIVNLHFSLLPRHRGPVPLYWTYVEDDRLTGVTVHLVDEGVDSGDVLVQEALTLERGRPLVDVYAELTRRAAPLAAAALEDLSAARRHASPQDASRGTHEPHPDSAPAPAYAGWPSERAWHVLAGLGGVWTLLRDASGAPVPHGPARSFATVAHDRAPGTLERSPSGFTLFCRDGSVDIAPAPGGLARRHRPRAGRV